MLSRHWVACCAVRIAVALLVVAANAAVATAQPGDSDPFGDFEGRSPVAPKPEGRGEQQRVAGRAQSPQPTRWQNEGRIEAELDRILPEPLDFMEIPLVELMQIIAEQYEIQVVFDTAALDSLAISPETEVTVKLRDISLHSALDLVLSSSPETEELTYLVDDEVLLITSEDEAQARLEVRVYRVDDLIRNEQTGMLDFDRVIELLATTVEHDSWQQNQTGEGCMIPLPPGMLVISQTRRVHQQIADLLAEVRNVKQQIEGETTAYRGATRPITTAIRIEAIGGDHAERSLAVIRDAVLHSVAWKNDGEIDNSDAFLAILPDRIIVRHTPEVVGEVTRIIDALQMRPAPTKIAIEKPENGGGFF